VLVLVAEEASTTAAGVAAGAVSLGLGASGVLTGRWLDGAAAHRVIGLLAAAHLPAVGVFLAVVDGGPTAAVAVAAFVAGSTVPPIGSVVRARLTGAVAESDHRRVFALESVTVELVWIAGPLLVSLLAVLTDRWVAVAASGLAAVAGSIGMMTGSTSARIGGGHGGAGPWLSGPVVRLVVAFAVIGAGFNVAMVGLAERAKQVDATELTGLLIGVWGVGSVLGGWWVATGRRTPGLGVLGVAVAVGVGVLSGAPGLLGLGVVLAVGGVPVAPFMSGVNALAGQVAPVSARARVFASMLAASTVLSSAGSVVGAALAEHVGPPAAFAASTVLILVAVALAVPVERSVRATPVPVRATARPGNPAGPFDE
jgi:hypothetical protein